MNSWPLRWKIACYAAGLGVLATIAGASTTWLVMHFAELAALDRQMARQATKMLDELQSAATASPSTRIAKMIETFIPAVRLVEVEDRAGDLLFRSAALTGAALPRGARKDYFQLGDRSYRVATFHNENYVVRLAVDASEIQRLGSDIILGMFAAIPTVLLVVSLGGRWIARQALGPVEEIREAAAAINIHNLGQRLPMPAARDEIAGLVAVLNRTFDRLQSSFEQSVRFCADASHQLKTPLAVLRAGIEEILIDPATPRKQRGRSEALLQRVHQLTSLTENLLLLARADAGRLELKPCRFDLREILDGVCDDAHALAERQGLTVKMDVAPELPVVADRQAAALITQNLVENAVKFNRPGGAIHISAQRLNGEVGVVIGNTGAGIPQERHGCVFDRFYRARGDQRIEGCGLGLSIARELARAQEGDVVLQKSDTTWTEFRLHLPASE